MRDIWKLFVRMQTKRELCSAEEFISNLTPGKNPGTYLTKAYPLSLNTRISWIDPNGAKVFCISSSVKPLVRPPQYTVQFVGLLWLYTSSNVNGFAFAEIKWMQLWTSSLNANRQRSVLLLKVTKLKLLNYTNFQNIKSYELPAQRNLFTSK